jgi:hypothetical protein
VLCKSPQIKNRGREFMFKDPATRGLEPISYRGALLSTLLHATVYVYTQFAECTSTDWKYKSISKKNLYVLSAEILACISERKLSVLNVFTVLTAGDYTE